MIAGHEVTVLMRVWPAQLDDRAQVELWGEYIAFLVTCVDRFAARKFNDESRLEFMTGIVETVGRGFVNQPHFGSTDSERIGWLERLIERRSEDLSPLKGLAEHIFAAATLMVKNFCRDLQEHSWPTLALETGKTMSIAINAALVSVPEFKHLL